MVWQSQAVVSAPLREGERKRTGAERGRHHRRKNLRGCDRVTDLLKKSTIQPIYEKTVPKGSAFLQELALALPIGLYTKPDEVDRGCARRANSLSSSRV